MAKMVFITVLSVLVNATVLKAGAGAHDRPNILFLLTDDQTFNTIRALGNREIFTPAIDKLVREGTAFTQAHIMGGLMGAICCPSRNMVLTGRTLFRLHKAGGLIPPADVTFPELFRANGYVTFGTGKWHQNVASFARSFSTGDNIFFGGMHSPNTGGHYRPRLHHYDSSGQYDHPFWGDHFSSVYFADAAVDFLKSLQHATRPFLMYVAFTSPHDPRTPPTGYGRSYQAGEISLPPNYLPMHPFDNGELHIRGEMLLPFPRTKEAVKEEIAKYYAMISEVDHQISRILEQLKQTGKDKNTLIVFTSDNGLAVGQHGLLTKQNPYESAMRVPLVFSGPGIPANKRVNAYVYLNDIYPTLCDMAGIPVPPGVEGSSLKAAFGGGDFSGRDHLFFAYANLQRAVVKDSFKLACYNVNGQYPVQLFDLVKDPWELHNLADEPLYRHKVSALRALLSASMKELNDFCDLDKAGWGYPGKMTWKEIINVRP
ncbi:sulfatase-like hydrolase/transferase [Chitinophaga alhagiae]|uniref:sulfatase-like hydrolase/transferase n=1 Tax=Chitinophaga alhagiae TaxID=2203219 RepID=UPI000E5A58B2|nr:sulfatase-like hydrolase/transferase [Chitinophaga alhagiae]